MKNHYLKILIFILLNLAYSEDVGAEMMRPATTNLGFGIFEKLSIFCRSEEQKIVKWRKKVGEKYGQFFGKSKGDGRNGKIAAIVFLSLGIVLFGLFGFTILVVALEAWGFWGSEFAIILVLISLGFLALSILCTRGVVRTIRKLHALKHGAPLEELPRREPSRQLKTN